MGPSNRRRRGLLRPVGLPGASTTDVVCCPHAGGTADAFGDWPALFGPDVRVIRVQYPGHGDRIAETPEADVGALAVQLADELAATTERTILFGHSFGAAVAFETAVALTRRGRPPRGVVVSARGAPAPAGSGTTADGSGSRSPATMTDEEIWRETLRLGGTPQSIAVDGEWRALLTPALRADFQASAAYRHRGPRLTCPLTAIVGADDTDVPRSAVRAWGEHTSSTFRQRVVAGGHFYLLDRPGPVAEEVWRLAALPSCGSRPAAPGGVR